MCLSIDQGIPYTINFLISKPKLSSQNVENTTGNTGGFPHIKYGPQMNILKGNLMPTFKARVGYVIVQYR